MPPKIDSAEVSPTRILKSGSTRSGCKPGIAMQTRPLCAVKGSMQCHCHGLSTARISLAPKWIAEINKKSVKTIPGADNQAMATKTAKSR